MEDPPPRIDASAEKVLTFVVVDKGTNRQGKAVTSSDGFTYGFHRRRGAASYWRCSSRSKAVQCPATLIERDGHGFTVGSRPHNHYPVANAGVVRRLVRDVKAAAAQDVFMSAAKLTEDHVVADLKHLNGAAELPNINHINVKKL